MLTNSMETEMRSPYRTAPVGLPDDLKNYRAPKDAFQLIDEGIAGLGLILLLVFCVVVLR